MRVVVCVKRAGALGDDVEFTDDGLAVDPDYLDFALNEWDQVATEEALRLREAAGGEVVVVTAGDEDAEEALVRCLAMGADRAVRVALEGPAPVDPLTLGRALAAAVRPLQPDLVLCGAQSSDAAQGATGSALAAVLGLPCAAVVTRVELAPGDGVVVHRELEGGVVDVVELGLPAVLTVQTGINEPRYVTLRAIQAARLAAIEVVDPGETGPPGYTVRRLLLPQRREARLIDGGAAAVAARISELVREASA